MFGIVILIKSFGVLNLEFMLMVIGFWIEFFFLRNFKRERELVMCFIINFFLFFIVVRLKSLFFLSIKFMYFKKSCFIIKVFFIL